jgi:hypothetical protein
MNPWRRVAPFIALWAVMLLAAGIVWTLALN